MTGSPWSSGKAPDSQLEGQRFEPRHWTVQWGDQKGGFWVLAQIAQIGHVPWSPSGEDNGPSSLVVM